MLLLDTASLKNPAAHGSHWGWAVMVPITFVYFPVPHLVWAVQESVVVPLVDTTALKNPD